MKKHLQILTLFAALLLPWAMWGQADSLTVASGTTLNQYVPIYSYYMDNPMKTQCIYPDDSLVAMRGNAITQLKFYSNFNYGTYGANTQVSLAITSNSSLASAWAPESLQTVWTGNVDVSNNEMVITFTTPFEYPSTGGNLLIQFLNVTDDDCGTSSHKFYGVTLPGHARYATSSTASGTSQNFLPKCTFTYAPVTCPTPSLLNISNITPYSADLSFHSSGTAWFMHVEPAIDEVSDFDLNDTTYAFSNLVPNTNYTVFVRNVCSSSDTSYTATVTFRTPCVDLTLDDLPYTEDFESYTSGSNNPISPCWNKGTSSSTAYPYPNSSSAVSGSLGLYFYGYYPSSATSTRIYSYAALPPVDETLPVNTLQLNFDLKHGSSTSATYPVVVMVGVMTDPTDISTFDTLHVLDFSTGASGEVFNVEAPLNSYTGTGRYVAILVPPVPPTTSTYTYNYVNIDNVVLGELPSCVRPSNFAAIDVQANEVTLSWQPGAEETTWIISDGENEYEVYDTTYTATELNANTPYTFTLRSFCGGDDTSTATFVSLRTSCGETVLPYVENFDAFPAGTGIAVPCWETMCGSSWNNVYLTSSYSSSSSNSMGFYSGDRYVATPRIPIAANEIEMSFMLKAESTTSSGTMMIGYATSPTVSADSITWVQTIQPSSTAWTSYEISFAEEECTDTVYVVFHQNYNSSAYYYWLDDLTIRRASSCPHVQNMAYNFTEDGTQITWTEMGEATSWELAAITSNNVSLITDDDVVYASEESYTFTDFVNGTTYYIFIRPECSDDVDWYGPIAVTPGTVNMPIVGNQTISGCGITVYDNGGATGNYTDNCNGYLTVYPVAADSLISFYGSYNTEGPSWDWIVVYEGENAAGNVLFDQREVGASQGTIDTLTSTVGPITIWFRSDGSTSYSGFELHTFCTPAPNCGDVTDINVQAGPNSALVSWTPGFIGEYTGATVEYRESDDPTAEWTSLTPTTETFIGITGLTPSTNYDVRVQSNCADGDGGWTLGQFMTGAYDCILMDSTSLVQDTIGNGSSTNSYFPTYSTYNYSVSQQIYMASEFDTAAMGGVITKIGFQLGNMSVNRDWNIYVTPTTQTSLSSGFITVSAADLVWSGNTATLTPNAWNEIELSSAFLLNGSNVLVTFQDMTGSWSGGNQGIVTSTGISGISRYIYQDGAPYDPTSSISGGTTSSDRLNMYFFGGTCLQQQTCAAPIVRAEATGETQISLSWVPGNTETSWNVYYRAAADTIFTLAGNATTDSYVLNNLQPSSHYFFKVASVCGTEEGGVAEIDCWTACGLTPVPFFEDFEAEPYGEFSRTCWYSGSVNLGTDYPYPYIVSLEGSDNKLMLLYNGGYIVLPEFNAPLNTLQARFNFVQGGDNVRLMLGLLENLDDPIRNITPIDTLIRSEYDPVNSSVVITYPFDMLPDTAHGHLVFYDAWSDNYSFIDDLHIEPIPSCTSVTGVTVSNVTSTSADVDWTEAGILASSYLVEYGPRFFTLGTGTQISTSTNSISLTGLNVGTTYEVYVYAVCSASGDTAIASNAAVFSTECAAITLPYTENFDNVLEPSAGSSTKQLPNCWHYAMTNSSYSSSSYYPTAYYNTSYSASGSYCLWLYGEAVTVLPEMPTTVDSLMISFHKYTSSTSYKLIVGAVDSITPGFENSFVGLDTINSNESDVFLFLNNYTGTGRYIAFKNIYNNNSYGYSYHYIDDIVVDYVPSCIYPMNFSTASASTTSADIAWTTSNADDYEYEYGVHGFTRGTGTTGTCIGQLASLTGLTISTSYDIYVRGICGAGDSSEWSMFTFSTLNADPATLPYVCDFADTTLVNAGFEFVNSGNAWFMGNVVSNGTPNSLYISSDNGVSNTYGGSAAVSYAYRDITIPGGEIAYSFDWHANGEGSYDYLRAWLAPVGFQFTAGQLPDGSTSTYSYVSSTPAGWISLDGGTKMNLMSNWQNQSGEISVPAGTYHLVFMWGNDGSVYNPPAGAIDNIQIFLNTCPKVQNLQASNVAASSMDITWTDTVAGLGWQIEYGPAGFSHGDPLATSAFTAQPHYSMSGLTGLTNYDIYVRHICSTTDTGMWNKLSVMSAMCDESTIAITYGDTTATATTTSYSIGYSLYDYSYSETIIDSAEMAALGGDVTAFAYHPASTTAGTYFTNCDVYLGHTSNSAFTTGPLYDTSFVLVFSGDLSYTDADWQVRGFDTPFTWDGHSNVVLVVNRQHGSYLSGSSFNAHNTSDAKTYYEYQDEDPFIPGYNTGDGTLAYFRADLQLISCAEACGKPVIVAETHDYQSATVTWTGNGNAYEVAVRTLNGSYGTPVAVNGTSYTFNGLQPATTYMFQVRQDCNADSLGYSDWTEGTFTTDSLPCFTPTNVSYNNVTFNTAELTWNTMGEETAWEIHVFNTTFDNYYEVTTNPATADGLMAGTSYSAAVRALCGSEHNIFGEWSDTIQFTTDICDPVTNVHATANGLSISLTWTAGENNCGNFEVEYGEHGFGQGEGTTVTVNGTSKTFNGLYEETTYDFYVRAVCAEGLTSAWSAVASATTGQATGDECYAPTDVNATANGNSITFTWTAATGNTAEFEVEYGQAGFAHGQGTTAQAGPEGFTANNLEANTTYDFYVRAICQTGNYSDWSDKASATTGNIGIYDVEGSFNCNIFPNPATDETTISVSGVNGMVTIAVVDMNGRTVSSETLDCAADCVKKMNVSGLTQGAYFVRIYGENVNSVKKLIVR